MAVIFLTAMLIQLKPPHKHTEASTLAGTNINNSVTEVPKTEQTADTQVNEIQPIIQEPVVEPPKPEPTVVHPVGCENYATLVGKYDWNVNVMTQICQAESGGNPNAVGDTWAINGLYAPSCGLFQIRTLAGRPDCETLKNPETNIDWAYKIYKGQGYNAWSVCRTKVSCY